MPSVAMTRLLALVALVAIVPAGCRVRGAGQVTADSIDPAELLGSKLPAPRRPSERPYTSFQSGRPYSPRADIQTGSAIVYSDDAQAIQSWVKHGYWPMCMWGPRLSREDVKQRGIVDEVQTLANGELLGHSGTAVYLAPGPGVASWATDYLKRAAAAGAKVIVPEESEYFVQAGYCAFFKREWQEFYGEPWRDPASSADARYHAEKLKAFLEARFLSQVFAAVKKDFPKLRCMAAEHSPVNYTAWAITCPHYEMCQAPGLNGIIGQVWTGTAQTPVRYEGTLATRTFENAFLEYSSLYNLARGTGRELWFLADPVEDVPGRPTDEYRVNYEQTVVASLMFPAVRRYEVMPWPERVFGTVPHSYATQVLSTVQALNRISETRGGSVEAGTDGIATFLADSAMWQRGQPSPSTTDGLYGMALPLLMRGIPVQIAQLECARSASYLKPYRVLLLSYDPLKPTDPAIHGGLARWVKGGGVLLLFGGSDPYNAVDDWWRREGFAAPHVHLLQKLGLAPGEPRAVGTDLSLDKMQPILREEKRVKDLANKRVYEADVSGLKGRYLFVSVGDSFPDDGWGGYLTRMELLADGRRVSGFEPFTPQEREHLVLDHGSGQAAPNARFMDADRYVVYRFVRPAASKVTLKVEIGNQFLVKAMASDAAEDIQLRRTGGDNPDGLPDALRLGPGHVATLQRVPEATTLYELPASGESIAWEKRVGRGRVMFVGIEPRFLAESQIGADLACALARRACRLAKLSYEERPYMLARRGPFVAVRTFDRSHKLEGSFVNVFDPNLALVSNPVIGPRSWGLWLDVTSRLHGKPRLLWASANVLALNERSKWTGLFCAGPLSTLGAARIWRGRSAMRAVRACNREGHELTITAKGDGETLLLTWPNAPDGAAIRVEWE